MMACPSQKVGRQDQFKLQWDCLLAQGLVAHARAILGIATVVAN